MRVTADTFSTPISALLVEQINFGIEADDNRVSSPDHRPYYLAEREDRQRIRETDHWLRENISEFYSRPFPRTEIAVDAICAQLERMG